MYVGTNASEAAKASARVAAMEISCMAAFALACCDAGSALSTLPSLWNQQRRPETQGRPRLQVRQHFPQ